MNKSFEWFSLPGGVNDCRLAQILSVWCADCTDSCQRGDKEEELMRFLWLILLALVTIPLAGCELAGDIFQAGVWVGVIFIVGIIAIVGFIAAKIRG
jgi:hypothetical protein